MKMKCLYEKYKSIIKFGIVGCINTGVDFAVFSVLLGFLGVDKLLAQVGGYSMGVINSFVLNKLWTFNEKTEEADKSKDSTAAQLVKFVFTNVVSLGISLEGLNILSNKFHMNAYAAKIIITLFLQVFNYVVYKLFIFKGKRHKKLAA